MIKLKKMIGYFTAGEFALWIGSVTAIIISFAIFDGKNILVFSSSLIGVTSLIFNAKGNPFGQLLMIIFSLLYGIVSFSFSYYGEMITYIGMTMPMALFALIAWLRHPYNGNNREVKVNRLSCKNWIFALIATFAVTFVFYFILLYFHTSNIIPSTLSVATSFIAVYLTFKRSPYFAVAYAANDIVLIVLWIMATVTNISYLSVVVCFAAFLVNDIYGFVNWRRIEKRQSLGL